MTESKKKKAPQKNKNNKTKPENLMKKEYLKSYEELKKSIVERQHEWEQNIHLEKYLEIL